MKRSVIYLVINVNDGSEITNHVSYTYMYTINTNTAIQYISGAPHEAFQQHVNVHVPQIHHVQCLRVLARPLSLVHNDF